MEQTLERRTERMNDILKAAGSQPVYGVLGHPDGGGGSHYGSDLHRGRRRSAAECGGAAPDERAAGAVDEAAFHRGDLCLPFYDGGICPIGEEFDQQHSYPIGRMALCQI